MAIIQKRADELKPGDIVVMAASNGGARGMILQSALQEHYSGGIEAIYFRVAILDEPLPKITKWGWEPEVELTVDAPDLTPAQQHAEELRDAVLGLLCGDDETKKRAARVQAERLLDKIKPPEPPTLAEALELLARIPGDFTTIKPAEAQAVRDVLDRARRSGVLK